MRYGRLRQQLKQYQIWVMLLHLAYIPRLGGFASLKAATRALQSSSNFREGKSEWRPRPLGRTNGGAKLQANFSVPSFLFPSSLARLSLSCEAWPTCDWASAPKHRGAGERDAAAAALASFGKLAIGHETLATAPAKDPR